MGLRTTPGPGPDIGVRYSWKAFDVVAADRNEIVLGGVTEDILEDQPVSLTVVGEISAQNFSQQFAALLQDNFEFFYAGRTVGVIGNFIRVSAFQLLDTVFKSFKAASEKFSIDTHGFCDPQARPPSAFSGNSYPWKIPQKNKEGNLSLTTVFIN